MRGADGKAEPSENEGPASSRAAMAAYRAMRGKTCESNFVSSRPTLKS